MSNLIEKYPLLLRPVIKDYLWGGTRLKTEFGFETDMEIAAEGWMLSCHKDGTNIVINGKHSGEKLDDVLKTWGYAETFPILIKLIDAKDKLSVQVHPDNAYALENEGEYGKTEMWYVVDCEEDAQLIYGFKKEISKEEFEEGIKKNTLDDVMNYVPVKKGDIFFIEAGTLHAIGKGILIAEIQQNSNSTYRVSDYGRLGADGKPRELHVQKAIDVTKTEKATRPYGNVGEITENDYGVKRNLAECEYFDAFKIDLKGKKEIDLEDGFMSVLVIDGKAEIEYSNEILPIKKGDSVLIPSGVKVNLSGNAELVCAKFDM